MNFFERLYEASKSTSRLTRTNRQVKRIKRGQKLLKYVGLIKRKDLDIGFKKRAEFDQEAEYALYQMALHGAQKFLQTIYEIVARNDEPPPGAAPRVYNEPYNYRMYWRVLESSVSHDIDLD